MGNDTIPAVYESLLDDLKNKIRTARVHAALSVNRELVLLYWQIGRTILKRQDMEGWGSKVIERLSDDLRREFPDMKGLSRTNLSYMRTFADAYPEVSIVQQLVGQLPWGHNVVLITKVKDPALREWYAGACIDNGWSRAVMVAQIESSLHERLGAAQNNFAHTLPSPQSELAQQILKDPYNFDFLTLNDRAVERDLQKGLLMHLRDFMLELGVGFAFVGSEYHLEVAGEDFYLDLLFYHLKLRCFVIVELKMTEFKPEYAGKINFYLSAVDDLLRHQQDNPTIGILLCKGKNHVVVEYSMRDMQKPLGVAEYKLARSLPDDLKGNLPTIEELEKELKEIGEEKSIIEPLVNKETEILVVGTYPGARSRESGQYYSDPRNQFWKLMSDVLDIDLVDMDYNDRTETLLKHKIGLWDAIKYCDITGSSDRDICNPVFNDFSHLVNVRKVICNGKKAGKYIGKCQLPENVDVMVVQSSSTANTAGFPVKLEGWKEAISFKPTTPQ